MCLCAEECAPGKFEKAPRLKQLEYLKCLHEANAKIPSGLQSQVLIMHARTMPKETSSDLAAFIETMSPFVEPVTDDFKLLSPRLSNSSLTSADRGRVCVRAVVLDSIVPWIGAGEVSAFKVDMMCTAWQEHLISVQEKGSIKDVVLEELLDLLRAITKGLLGLLGSDDPSKYTQSVHQIIDSRGSGARFILKNAIVQNSWWKQLQGSFMTAATASETVTPEMKMMIEKLKEEEHKMSTEALQDSAKKILMWRDMLRAGATACLEKAFLSRLRKEAESARQEGDSNLQQQHLSGLHEVLMLWLAPVLSQSLVLAGLNEIVGTAKTLMTEVKGALDEVATAVQEEALTEKLAAVKFAKSPTPEMLQGALTVLAERSLDTLKPAHVQRLWEMSDMLQTFVINNYTALDMSEVLPSTLQLLKTIADILEDEANTECLLLLNRFRPLVEQYSNVKQMYPGLEALYVADTGGRISASIAKEVGELKSLEPNSADAKKIVNTLSKEVVVPVEVLMKELAGHSQAAMEAEVAKATADVEKICGGCKAGRSWKATVLDENVAWNSVLVAAKPLLTGEVSAELTTAFKALQQVCRDMACDVKSERKGYTLYTKSVCFESHVLVPRFLPLSPFHSIGGARGLERHHEAHACVFRSDGQRVSNRA